MPIHIMEIWKPFLTNIPAVLTLHTVVHFMSIQETLQQFHTQRSEMLPAQCIPIQRNLSCFPNQFLIHYFQL